MKKNYDLIGRLLSSAHKYDRCELDYNIDALINVKKDRRIGNKSKWMASHVGKAQWSQGDYESPYSHLLWVLRQASPSYRSTNSEPSLVVDVGSSYGRMGVIAGVMYEMRKIKYVGYEIAPDKVKEAQRITEEFSNVKFIQQDLSLPEFKFPTAKVYYMYDPVNIKTLPIVLDKISEAAADDSVIIFRYGTYETMRYMERNYPAVGCHNDMTVFLPNKRKAKAKKQAA